MRAYDGRPLASAWTSRASRRARGRPRLRSSRDDRPRDADRRQRGADLGGGERRDVDDLEPGRRVAQQPVRPRHVARGQDEPVAARCEHVDQVAQDRAQAGEALERAQLEELVEQERRRRVGRGPRAVSRNASAASKAARAPGSPRPGSLWRCASNGDASRDRVRGSAPASSRCAPRRCTATRCGRQIAQPQQERRAAGAAAAEEHGDAEPLSGGPSSAARTRRSSEGRSGIIIAPIPRVHEVPDHRSKTRLTTRSTTTRSRQCRSLRSADVAADNVRSAMVIRLLRGRERRGAHRRIAI